MISFERNMLNFGLLFCLFICLSNAVHSGQEISGCGGFIKSYTEIDYSKVEVKLFTKQGSLKDKTDCSPSNGYYFLPLYSHGDYVLKISPPTGWSFEPSEIPVSYDGKTDSCSLGNDLNFIFKGFGITGVVAVLNSNKNAADVAVKLLSETNEILRTTTSDSNGVFYFTPVFPGKYVIEVSHDKWNFIQTRREINVEFSNTELPADYFVVSGFEVDGRILNDNHPVKSIGVALYSESKHSNLCDTTIPANLLGSTIENGAATLWCYSTVAANGQFKFKNVPSGKYHLKPDIINKNIKLHIKPDTIELTVESDSVTLSTNFHVTGFSVRGRVLVSPNGRGISNAEIKIIGGKDRIKTDSNGNYIIDNIIAGTYIFQISSTEYQFNEQTFKVSIETEQLTDIVASAFLVCGQITSKLSHTIVIKQQQQQLQQQQSSKRNDEYQTQTTDGNWCLFLPKGKYTASVLITDEDRNNGIQFFPLEQQLEVVTSSISGLMFSQLRAHVTGDIKCLPDADELCKRITVNLYSLNPNGKQNGLYASTNVIDGQFNFADVLPGTYEVTISSPSMCWETTTLAINVQSIKEIVPTFIHTGYLMSVDISHTTQMQYKYKDTMTAASTAPAKNDIILVPGLNSFCVPLYGKYEAKFIGCHTFDIVDNSLTISPGGADDVITIKAIKHINKLRLMSKVQHQFECQIENQQNELKNIFLTLDTKKGGANNLFVYSHDFEMAPNERLTITPLSETMLFKPTTAVIVGGSDCVNDAFTFNAYEGIIINGRIDPPITGVELQCQFDDIERTILKTISDENGEFKFKPIDIDAPYTIVASKDSYVFSEFDPIKNMFKAHKLCEIIASVTDEKGNSLSGVLLSLSGAESYRKNVITSDDGIIKFHSLSPSQYYLRPMMKEYTFGPSNKIINLKDGETINVELIGKRIAYSLYGNVNSLNGDPFPNCIVESNAQPPCGPHQEEATTDQIGAFRILGLEPNCQYSVRVKPSAANNVDRTIPAEQIVNVGEEEIRNVNIFAISPINFVDVAVRVIAANINHYKSLKVQMYKTDSPSDAIYTQKLDIVATKSLSNRGVMAFMPRIPLDQTLYTVEVTSNAISDRNYQNVLPIATFVANQSSVFIQLDFNPEAKSADSEINGNSIYVLILIAIIAIALYKQEWTMEILLATYNRAVQAITNAINQNRKKEQDKKDFIIDDNEIEKLAQSINATKRKPARKQ